MREREKDSLEQYGARSFSLASLVYKFTRGRKRILLNELGEIMSGINSTNDCIAFLFPAACAQSPYTKILE